MSDKQGSLIESMESLIAHMSKTRRLFVILIVAAFVIAPTSAVFAIVLLYTDIPSKTGQEYIFSVDLEDLPRSTYGVPPIDDLGYEVEGWFDGEFDGKVLGEYLQDPEFEMGGFYVGEFVGEFDGESAIMFGEFTGEFTGEFDSLYDGIDYNGMGYGETYGLYEGRFAGAFTGTFYNIVDIDAFSQRIDVLEIRDAYSAEYPIEFVSEEEYFDYEFIPRFMVIDDESIPYEQTDITLLLLVFVVIVTSMSAIVLYVGLHELLFYSRWNSRFQKYLERKSEIDRELGED